MEWSDPLFCEMFTDIYRSGKPADISDGEGAPEAVGPGSKMTVVFRDRPFPVIYDNGSFKIGLESAWFNLPLNIVPRGQLGSDDLGRGGSERFNAFLASPGMVQENLGAYYDLIRPLWNKAEIHRHGIRRLDIAMKYMVDSQKSLSATNDLRYLLMNYHALNPYLLNGTIPLVVFRPDIRIGQRVRIPDAKSKSFDETYYVEGVSNSWMHNKGRTSLSVTRGFVGSDNELLSSLSKVAGDYEVAQPAVAG